MHIFIDESGNFETLSHKKHSISTVGALVIPTSNLAGFERLYQRLRRSLPKSSGEVKGRLLSERQVQEVVQVLKKVGAIFEVIAIDMGQHTVEDVEQHRKNQAENITKFLTNEHHENLVREIWELRRFLESLSLQLYVQSVAMGELVYKILNHSNVYFAFRLPKELGEYHWIIDAKDRQKVTPWEEWWSKVILPMIESHSFREPFFAVEGADYRWHERFRSSTSDYKRQFMKDSTTDEIFDLKLVMQENFRFSSQPEFGLEAVDILTNAVRRSLSGNFQRTGWAHIPRVMINRKDHCIGLITIMPHGHDSKVSPYVSRVFRDFQRGGRSILPKD